MRQTLHPYTLSNWYYIGVLLMLVLSTYLAMPDMDNTVNMGSGMSFWAMIGLAIVQTPLWLYIFSQRVKTNTSAPRFIVYYGVYFCWMMISCVLTDYSHNIYGVIAFSLTLIMFPFMLGCSYYRSRYSDLDKWFYAVVILLFVCITYQYYNLYSIANMIGGRSHMGISYFPLFILPILLLSSSRIVRYSAIVITSIIIISSVKRGGLITLGICLMVYVYVMQWISGKNKMRQIIIVAVVIAMMSGVIYFLMQSEENNVIERVMSIKDDGGSERDVLWRDVFNQIQDREFISHLIGNGYRSTQKVTVYALPAHNDVLEIWYDFGGIGIILYGMAFLSLCIYTIRLLKRKSRYAPHLAMTLTFYFLLSMISIVILYFWMVLLMFTIGIIAGLADRELEEQKGQQPDLVLET